MLCSTSTQISFYDLMDGGKHGESDTLKQRNICYKITEMHFTRVSCYFFV